MCGCRQSLQHAGLSKEETTRPDAHESAFLARIRLLESAERLDERDGLGFSFEDRFNGRATRNYQDIEVGEVFMRVRVVGVGFDSQAGGGCDPGLRSGDGALECGGVWRKGLVRR